MARLDCERRGPGWAVDGASPPMTAIAIALAVTAAIAFGIAAVNQHQAVRAALDKGANAATTWSTRQQGLSPGQLGGLLADPVWRRGFALMALGTGMHVTALSLAPISLTQPLNVLAVPTAIIATAAIVRRRPRLSMLAAAAAVVVGVAAFVTSLSNSGPGDVPSPAILGLIAAAVVGVIGGLHGAAGLLSRRHTAAPVWVAPVLLGIAGAVAFGCASSTYRVLAQDLAHTRPLPLPVALALACAIPIALAGGAWSIHQAYAAGAAAAVTAVSALTDPIVAIGLGVAVLGEHHHLTPGRLLVMVIAAGLAAVGVAHLADHQHPSDHKHPTEHQHPTERPTTALPLRAAASSVPIPLPTRTMDAHPARR